MANILIADDHLLFAELIKEKIEANSSHIVNRIYSNGVSLFNGIEEFNPKIVITDIRMPDGDGIYLCKKIKESKIDIHIIVITQVSELGTLDYLIENLVSGIVNKSSSESEILKSIDVVLSGEKYLCSTTQKVLDTKRRYDKIDAEILTKREIEVLNLLCTTLSHEDISNKLYISVNTLLTHKKTIMRKLKVKNVQGMILESMKQGYVSLDLQ